MARYEERAMRSWEEFLAHLQRLREEHQQLQARSQGVTPLLFRGHRDENWKLDTTLERSGKTSISLLEYYRAISKAKPEIQSYTGKEWLIEQVPEFARKASNPDAGFSLMAAPPAYDYMAYLRHHGFPSPFLDWSRSPYIAAYFAFREPGDPAGRVAIFAYRERAGGGKIGEIGAPTIDVRGPYVHTHKRHFIQQCQYTVCTAFRGRQWHYVAHEEIFAVRGADDQDQFWKFTLPRDGRLQVLQYLDDHNLNAHSLFGSEEALMETMAFRALLKP